MNTKNITDLVYQVLDTVNAKNVHSFLQPKSTLIGAGAVSKVAEVLAELNIEHVFVVIDQSLFEMGLAEGLLRALNQNQIKAVQYLQKKGEPESDTVKEMTKNILAHNCQGVIAFGGGSVIDAAKAALILAANPNLTLSDFVNLDQGKLKLAKRVPFIAIPTTAGTGSEATSVTVIIDSQTHHKLVIAHPDLIPDVAVIDACLTLPVPSDFTAITGIDALTHAIESYVAIDASPLTKALAYQAITLIGEALPIAVGQGSNIEARESMMLASYMAGIAFSNAGLGLGHAMAHQIGPAYRLSHGLANAIMLPSIMSFNLLVCKKKYAEIGLALSGCLLEAEQTIAYVQKLICDVGLPQNLSLAGGKRDDFAEFAERALQDICIKTNPRSVNQKQIIEVYQHALTR